MRPRCILSILSVLLILAGAACASAPGPAAPRATLTYEEKMAWILRLEEDRVLRVAPAEPPPASPPQGGRRASVTPAPPPSPDLIALLKDPEPRLRWRAALATGRVRLPEGIPPLADLVSADPDADVRQVAAFALGLIGHADAADVLMKALSDSNAVVQGRAAEALGMIGHKPAADAIAAMIKAHIDAGALQGIAADDSEYPKSPAAEAVRLGMYALVRLTAYDALAAALLDASGQPRSRWWPVAYAFQRMGDPKAAPVLLTLLQGEGTTTRAFAARGLGTIKEARAVVPLVAILNSPNEPLPIKIQAARALGAIGAREAIEPLAKVLTTPKMPANLRLEAVTALGAFRNPELIDYFVDLVTEPWPSMRAAALIALAQTDPSMFLTAISGLDPDPHWSVRGALASALGLLDAARAEPRLRQMLDDSDQRVIPFVLNALVSAKAPSAPSILVERLSAEDVVVRQAAANGLARLKATTAVPALVSAYDRAEKDPTYVAAAAILGALVELDAKAAQPLLVRALEHRDWALRVRAAALLSKIDPAADLSRMRPAPATGPPELNDLKALIAPTVSPTAYIDTDKGVIEIELAVVDAPRTVANFISLARRNFLGGTPWHRVVPDFVVQDGDPRGDGEGGPGYSIRDEINLRPFLRGTVGMALDWEDTGGSQFFITHSPQPHLDGRYTVFGQVVNGLEVLDQLQQWDQIRTVRVWDGQNWIGGE